MMIEDINLDQYKDDELADLLTRIVNLQDKRRVEREAPARIMREIKEWGDSSGVADPFNGLPLWGIAVDGEVVPYEPVPHFGHGPGRHVEVEGVEYRNDSGAWLTVPPNTSGHEHLWTRVTPVETIEDPENGSPVEYPEWDNDTHYEVGDKCQRGGVAYEALVPHGKEHQGTWGPPTVGIWKVLGPVG